MHEAYAKADRDELMRLWKVSGDRIDDIADYLGAVELENGPNDLDPLRPEAGHT